MTADSPSVSHARSALIPIRYQVLIGAIIVQLILGTVYGYSIFWQPLNSEVFPQVITEAEQATMVAQGVDTEGLTVVTDAAAVKTQLATQQGYLKYAFSICILSFAITMIFAGRVQDVRGPRQPAIIGAVLMGMGFFAASFMNYPFVFFMTHAMLTGGVGLILLLIFDALLGGHDTVRDNPMLRYVPQAIIIAVAVAGVTTGTQFVGKLGAVDKIFMLWATVGFLAGAGIGFAYVCPIAALYKWFPNAKGLVGGIAVAGFGFGAYLFTNKTIGAVGYIQDHGITEFFLVHGMICLVAVTFGAFLLRNPPRAAAPGSAGSSGDSTWRDTLKRPSFYMLWLMFFSGAMAGLMVIGIIKGFAGDQLVSGARAAAESAGKALSQAEVDEWKQKGVAAVGALAIFNAIGRIVWGLVSDKIGRTLAMMAMFIFQAVTLCLLTVAKTEWSIAIVASVIGFNFGGNFALFPSATADLFGAKNVGANYGWVFTSYGIAGVIGIAAGNMAKHQTGDYEPAFYVAAALCVISAILAIALGRSIAKMKANAATA